MTQTLQNLSAPSQTMGSAPEQPKRQRGVSSNMVLELLGSAAASLVLVWLAFTISGISGPLGFGFCCVVGFFFLYSLLCWQIYGVMAMRDRLATVAIWTGALVAFIPLVAVILYVAFRGGSVIVADFPHFFYAGLLKAHSNFPCDFSRSGSSNYRND